MPQRFHNTPNHKVLPSLSPWSHRYSMTPQLQESPHTDPRCIHAKAITRGNVSFFNKLIILYSASNIHSSSALRLFLSIRTQYLPNARILSSILKTCAFLTEYKLGPQLHSLSFKLSLSENPFVGSGLVSLYCKVRDSGSARKVFDEMSERDEVCFGAMINGLAQNKRFVDALHCFAEMRREGVASTVYSVSGALRAASGLAMLEQCRVVHGHGVRTGFDADWFVGTGLIDGYGKCGVVEETRRVFDELGMGVNIAGWNAMMAGYAQLGCKDDVLDVFRSMERRGMEPDEYSFLAVLTAFYNKGMAKEAEVWLNRMKMEYGLEPRIEHYTCLVGAMGKSGRMDEAEKLVSTMPYDPDAALWRVMLSSCVNGGNTDVGWRMSEKLLELDPNDDSAYVILANVFASAGRWDEVKKVWKMMRDKRVRKEIARSWIEAQGKVHVFFSGDRRHVRRNEIYAKLEELMEDIEKLGYVPNSDEMLHDMGEEEKKEFLRYHSEKLAVAFGLLDGVTPIGKPLRIVKNLRICRDCHEAFKYISKSVGREIVVRDVNRYHKFLNGSCICGDSW